MPRVSVVGNHGVGEDVLGEVGAQVVRTELFDERVALVVLSSYTQQGPLDRLYRPGSCSAAMVAMMPSIASVRPVPSRPGRTTAATRGFRRPAGRTPS